MMHLAGGHESHLAHGSCKKKPETCGKYQTLLESLAARDKRMPAGSIVDFEAKKAAAEEVKREQRKARNRRKPSNAGRA